MNTLEGKAWHSISGAKGIGSRTLWLIADYLQNRGKTASWLLVNPDKIQDILQESKTNIVMPDFFGQENKAGDRSEKRRLTVLHPLHADFPQAIRTLKDKISLPAVLYLHGNVAILKRTAVAIVGKRNAGVAELAAAGALASELAAKGVNIVSGYAAGIDTAAHLGALRAGGTTSVVLAEGIRHFRKKPELDGLLTEENTLVLSQFEPDAKWSAYMAMTRNRLVSALCGAVVVIVSGPERNTSGRNSGTFNAALAALKMGITTFVADPGFFSDCPEGNRQLIAMGCQAWDPASGAAPILDALNSEINKNQPPKQRNLFP
jgi:DNA processing protein